MRQANSHDLRLSEISTLWSAVDRAHRGQSSTAISARKALLMRYQGAVTRYLRGAVRDDDAVHELFQEFVVRLLRGDFHRVSPDRGRFRDYVRSVLINLVNDYRRQASTWPRPLAADVTENGCDQQCAEENEQFLACWRQEIMQRTWDSLQHGYPEHYRLLRLLVNAPGQSSQEMSRQLADTGSPLPKPDAVRKRLQRARETFADLLIDEVVMSLRTTQFARIRQELVELNLLGHCRSALDRWIRRVKQQ